MFGVCSPNTCSRVGCDKPPKWHIIWTADVENGLTCDEHLAEARRLWVFYAVHSYEPGYCSHPKALYYPKENVCAIPIEDVDWDVAAAAELPDSVPH
jgi:hypothetical protein